MSWKHRLAGEDEDLVVEQALRNFKASVDAWSEVAWSESASRPRTPVRRLGQGWRLATGWALGCVLAAGSVAGALYERRHTLDLARIAAAQAAAEKIEQVQLASRQKTPGQTDQDLLATVDSDISRAVPAAMEPLAQMMDEKSADDSGTQQ
jgi:hypothetical protein